MKQLGDDERHLVKPLFDDWHETLIWSYLQGHAGEAWVNQIDDVRSAVIVVGDFAFFRGEVNKVLVANLLEASQRNWLLAVGREKKWHLAIEEAYKDRCKRFMRYAIKKEGDQFDRIKLNAYVNGLDKQFELRAIDEVLYKELKQDEWGMDLCGIFKDYDDFAKMALGYVVMKGEEIVSGASSYSAYDGGIEVEIDTRKAYRRQGLARACGAKLILACLEKGLYPSWDAANMGSVTLSEQLGYHLNHEYITYSISRSK